MNQSTEPLVSLTTLTAKTVMLFATARVVVFAIVISISRRKRQTLAQKGSKCPSGLIEAASGSRISQVHVPVQNQIREVCTLVYMDVEFNLEEALMIFPKI